MNTETVPSFSPLVEVGLNLPPPLPLLVLFCILICTTIAFQSQFSYTQYSLSYKNSCNFLSLTFPHSISFLQSISLCFFVTAQ